MELAAAAMFVAIAAALPLGIIAAVWRGTVVDHAATTGGTCGPGATISPPAATTVSAMRRAIERVRPSRE